MARRPLRTTRALLRQIGARPPRSITLIVCEGETEQAYFEAARVTHGLSTTEVVCADNTHGPAPISVVECAERKCQEVGGYDHVFCVFDRDGHESYQRARKRVQTLANRTKKPLPIRDVVSVPCFEFWVLLHLERTDKPFDRCADVIAHVRRHQPGYKKADTATVAQLMPRLATAIANAEWVEQRSNETGSDSITTVHHIIRHFERLQLANAQ